MDYFVPESLEEAVRLLAEDEEARCLAGGQTLVAMMNIGIAAPSRLISLKAIPDLKAITPLDDGGIRIGAMTTHSRLADAVFTGAQSIIPDTARQIAHPAIRSRGTIGGSIAHADPAADFPSALVAADAVIEAVGPGGAREISADDFFVDYLTTALEVGELVTAIRLPPSPKSSSGIYYKFSRVDGDYATLSVAVCLSMEDRGCSAVRVALGSCGERPVREAAAEAALIGTTLDPASIAAAAKILQVACRPEDDVRGTADYRRAILPGLLARTIAHAAAKCNEAPR